MGALLTHDLSCAQGEDVTYGPFVWATADQSGANNWSNLTYYNFTGAAARMMVRATSDPTSTLIFTSEGESPTIAIGFSSQQVTNGPATPAFYNAFAMTIAAAASLATAYGVYYYDLFIDWPGGTHQLFLAGKFDVKPTVTR
jgi:hypothetical protein